MQVNSEDITVAWGQQPHQLDSQYGKWRMAVFQDVQESIDGSKLYFLYDPQADEQSGTSGQRKGYPGLIIFDIQYRCFAGEIAIHNPGKMKFLFALKCPSPQGGSSFVLVTEEEIYGQCRLNVSRVDLAHDGLSIANVRSLITSAIVIDGEYICSMRDDLPEIVVMANPGLQVWRIDCMSESPQSPVAHFSVPGADLTHFYDGFLNNGNIVFLSATPDGHFDNTRIHLLNLSRPEHITSQNCSPDPSRGMPIPRKQCGFDSITHAILMAGGEVDRGHGNFERLLDYWILDTNSFQWRQIPSQMPCPLIEPRLTACNSGNIYVWGDFDQPLPGMPPNGTHLRILRVSGLEKAGHPPPYSSFNPAPPAYPTLDDGQSKNFPAPYNNPASNAGPRQAPPYPEYNPNQSNYGNAGYQAGYSQPQNDNYGAGSNQPGFNSNQGNAYSNAGDGQNAYYPPPQNKKKDCSIQ
uniref:Uncharacterized protein n=1 Tax=Caenorhabditis japonica TaxID=281687 RepID=A0A8R1HVV6_CAEJA